MVKRFLPGQRFWRFVIVGGVSSALFLVLAYALTVAGLSAFSSSLIAYAISFGVAYVGQRAWTFGSRHAHGHALPRYLILQVLCALSTAAVAEALVDLLATSAWTMSILTTIFAGVVSYVVSWLWVFPDSHDRPPDR